MQKKVIALALAGLASGAVFAQDSTLTLYGGMDAGPVRYFGSKSGTKAMTAIETGKWASIRLGVKGTQDVGDGVKLKFKMDISTKPDDKSKISPKTGYIGFESKKYGELLVGGLGTFADDLQGDISTMFGHDTIAAGGDVWLQANGGSENDDMYNAIAWYSPKWNGLQVKLGFSSDSSGSDEAPEDDILNDRVWAAAVQYENGGLILGAYYDRSQAQSNENNKWMYSSAKVNADGTTKKAKYITLDNDYGNQWGVGGSYDFGFMRVHAVYNRMNFNDWAAAANFDGMNVRKQWQVGAGFPIGAKGNLAIAYTKAKNEYLAGVGNSDDIKMFGIGYWYWMSKTAALYAAYGQISDQKGNIRQTFVDDGDYTKAIQTGIRYKF